MCPDCHHTSITFDPLMYLSLPLPVSAEKLLPILVVFADSARKPTMYGVRIASTATVGDFKRKLSELCGVRPFCVLPSFLVTFRRNGACECCRSSDSRLIMLQWRQVPADCLEIGDIWSKRWLNLLHDDSASVELIKEHNNNIAYVCGGLRFSCCTYNSLSIFPACLSNEPRTMVMLGYL